jgi:selenocysteine-specific elongation factor
MVTIKEPTRRILAGTAGHIAHGKSSLVKMFTGCEVNKRPEEKRRGMTIDLGFANCQVGHGDIQLGIIDVPGHEKFVRNMVAGVSALDMIILVIAANDGVMPQTREHLQIINLIGIPKGLVVMTKIDMVDAELRALALEDIQGFVKGTFLEGAPIVPLSTTTGEGYDEFWEALSGVAQSVTPRDPRGIFRMPVERVFSVKGIGTVVAGMPLSGMIRLEDKLELLPGGQIARVRGMQVFSKESKRAMAGECVALNLPELDHKALRRGLSLSPPGYFKPASLVDVRLTLLASCPQTLKDGAPVRFHSGTAEVMGKVALLDRRKMEPGESALVQLRLEEPVVVDAKDRYIIRLQSPAVTIGGGLVLREQEKKLKRFKDYVLEDLEAREKAVATDEGVVAYALQASGAKPLKRADLEKATRLPAGEVDKALEALRAAGALATLPGDGGHLHRDGMAKAVESLAGILGPFHDANPLRSGMPRPALRTQAGWERNAFDFIVREGAASGRLHATDSVVGLADRQPRMDPDTEDDLARLERAFLDGGFSPPAPAQAAEALGRDEARARALIGHLVDRGTLVELPEDIFFHQNTVEKAKDAIVGYLREHGEIGAVTFRDLVDASRKFVYPLLDYFDIKGITVRRGNLRYLRKAEEGAPKAGDGGGAGGAGNGETVNGKR